MSAFDADVAGELSCLAYSVNVLAEQSLVSGYALHEDRSVRAQTAKPDPAILIFVAQLSNGFDCTERSALKIQALCYI